MARYQLVVLVGEAEWRVVHFRGWRYQALYVFSADADNRGLLLDNLGRYPGANLYFLTDLAEEHYHIETCPPVRGAARKQLLARRLAAWPFAQGLHAVHRVGCTPGLPQAERYLFAAIHNQPLSQWLQSQALRVQGVYTQALCSPCWATYWRSGHAQCLIGYFEKQQLRLRYLYQSQLMFSRLITLVPDASLHLRISSEIAQTRLYLLSQQWLQEGEPLQLLWLSDDAECNVATSKELADVIQQSNLSYAELMRQSGWPLLPDGLAVMDWAAIQVVLHNRRLPNLAPKASLLNARVIRAKRMITLAGVFMICLFVVANCMSQQALQKKQSEIRRTRALLQLWQSAKPAWKVADADLPRLQAFSEAVQGLEAAENFPGRALTILQAVVKGQTVWQVNNVDWGYGYTPASGNMQSAVPDRHWAETVTIRFAKQKAAHPAEVHQAWQALLESLRLHPDILELKEVNDLTASSGPTQQGDTRLSLSPDHQPSLTVRLRPAESTGR